jgi:hypothetical protein
MAAPMSFREWLERYGRAWREGDAEVLGEIFTENAVYRSQAWHVEEGRHDPPPGWGGWEGR